MRTAPRSNVSSSITRIFGILCRLRSVQHLTDLSRQRLRRERFLEEGRAWGEDALRDVMTRNGKELLQLLRLLQLL